MDTANTPNQVPPTGPPDQNSNGSNVSAQQYSDSPSAQQFARPQQQQWQEQPPVMSPSVTQPSTQRPVGPSRLDPYGVDSGSTSQMPQQPVSQEAVTQSQQQTPFNQQKAQGNTAPQQPQPDLYQQSSMLPGMIKPKPEEVLFEWQAESRPFLQRRRKHFTTVGLICVLIAMILFFAGQVLPVAVILAVFFLYYVLNSTPPGIITHKLTTYGIRIEDSLYYWEELGRFWFTEKFGKQILHIEVERFPFRLTMLLGDLNKDDMQALLSEVLLFQVPPPTTYEKVATWLEEKLPIDIDAN